jgi:hypothetical protein
MRFHSKFGLQSWFFAFNSLIFGYDLLSGHHMETWHKFFGILFLTFFIFLILKTFFVYWEFDGEVLRERRFWKSRTFRPNEILSVSGAQYWGATPSSIRIDYFRIENPLKSGKLYLDPKNLSQFVDKLRGFAREAAFDI